jgi:KDO2-lipid IV(A) lauroyltransferase
MLAPVYRRRFEQNAARAGVGPQDRRRAIAEAGRMLLELPRLWLRPHGQPIADPLRWEGAELIEAALGRPGGLIFMTPHLGSFEVAAQAYAERFGGRQPMTVLYRPARKARLRAFEDAARARPGLRTAPASLAGVRQLLRALQSGQTVGLLPDQVPPQGLGVWAPFFGQPAYTMTLVARLARQTGATLLLAWCERLPQGEGYVIHVAPPSHPLAALPVDSSPAGVVTVEAQHGLQASAAAINRSMETLVAACPSQYLWGYDRYKAPRGLR